MVMVLILLIIGFLNAVYLAFLHFQISPACIVGDGCNIVLSSIYSSIFGVPLAAIGAGVFLLLLLAKVYKKQKHLDDETYQNVSLYVLLPASAAAIVLLFVQWLYIHAFCVFCTLNSILFIALFTMTMMQRKTKSFALSIPVPQLISLVLIGLIPVLVSVAFVDKTSEKNNEIAVVFGEPITNGQLMRSRYRTNLLNIERREYAIKKRFIEEKVLEFQAKKEGVAKTQFVEHLVKESDVEVNEDEIQVFYNENKHRIPKSYPDRSYEGMKDNIKEYLLTTKKEEVIKSFLKKLEDQHDLIYNIKLSTVEFIRPNKVKVHYKGTKEAPIRIVGFSDLQCRHCKKAHIELKKLLKKYDGKIYYEFRHFPLSSHKFSKEFAKASLCSGEQKKFFEYIDLSYANQSDLDKIRPKSLAEKLGLDIVKFNECMIGSYAQAILDEDIKEGNRVKISSTPTFYINGQVIIGRLKEKDIINQL